MEFGLLNQDALWIMDEVQLMDVGLATSGQLQAFRNADQQKMRRRCFTWWMSATLRQSWLEKSPETIDLAKELQNSTYQVGDRDRTGSLWSNTTKSLETRQFGSPKELARSIAHLHRDAGYGKDGPTLVVMNTVERAVDVWNSLRTNGDLGHNHTDVRLMHSRFRPLERQSWQDEFLKKTDCAIGTNRIMVSTQVVEAGVDISTPLLVTEIAPWPSLVQRFGRCARWGGSGRIIIADFNHDNKTAAPYSLDDIEEARSACEKLPDAAPLHIERFEKENRQLVPKLYPYEPSYLLLRHELDELFDTSTDLSGADIDISHYIRSGNERDVQVFWSDEDDESNTKPVRDGLCNVPFLKARDWLCRPKSERLKPGVGAYVWNWLERKWKTAGRSSIYPGQTIMVKSDVGGYAPDRGWDPDSKERVDAVLVKAEPVMRKPCWRIRDGERYAGARRVAGLVREDHADAAEGDESLSVANYGWQTIATHGLEVGKEAKRIAALVSPDEEKLLYMAGRWHDLGKSHFAFQNSIKADDRPVRDDIAKAPDAAWPCSAKSMYGVGSGIRRPGFRHELASALGLFCILERHEPLHQALLGPWTDWFDALGARTGRPISDTSPTIAEKEILDLTADEFDLVAYLVCSHHGKVRTTWHPSPTDQDAGYAQLSIRGVQEGDALPSLRIAAADGEFCLLPKANLNLSPSETGLSPRTGKSWNERVSSLIDRLGPFTLAWLEALLRAADLRISSSSETPDPLLREGDAKMNADGSWKGRT